MHDRPTAAELIDAVRQYLETELLPSIADARLRFQTLIAANVLAIAGRELASEDEALREEWRLLAGVLNRGNDEPQRLDELRRVIREANRELCAQIRRGDFDEAERRRGLAGVLRRLVVRKLEVANPRYERATANLRGP
jgi:hypothetical protein